jgi:hypothetical protein
MVGKATGTGPVHESVVARKRTGCENSKSDIGVIYDRIWWWIDSFWQQAIGCWDARQTCMMIEDWDDSMVLHMMMEHFDSGIILNGSTPGISTGMYRIAEYSCPNAVEDACSSICRTCVICLPIRYKTSDQATNKKIHITRLSLREKAFCRVRPRVCYYHRLLSSTEFK